MIIKTFVSGRLDNNNFIVIDDVSKEAVLIDCSEYLKDFKTTLDRYNATLKYVLITHGHFDHVLGLNEFHENYPEVPIYVHKDDEALVKDIGCFVDRFIGGLGTVTMPPISEYIDENKELSIGEIKIKMYHTPGHTKGGVCYLIGDKLFSGDTIFYGSVGRTDLPGGSYEQIVKSVKNLLETLDEKVEIYTGHGSNTNVAYEKKFNPVM